MQTRLQVLSEEEQGEVHERSLKILARTGVRVDTARGRQILKEAGAQVDENARIVRFPQNLIEQTLALVPKNFTLGARRPGWDLPLNTGECNLLLDGEGTSVLDRKTGKHRPSTFHDWLEATRLADALDDIGTLLAHHPSYGQRRYGWGLCRLPGYPLSKFFQTHSGPYLCEGAGALVPRDIANSFRPQGHHPPKTSGILRAVSTVAAGHR